MKPSGTLSPLLRKLRYAPDMQVYVAGAPVGFETELRAAKVSRAQRPGKSVGLVQVFSTRRSQVLRTLAALDGKLAPGTIVWLCYPKAKALETDLNRDVLRETAAEVGLTAVAIVAIDDVWSGLRCKLTP
jgi:hypothetical protein